ncbi:hypothetical protein MSG28_015983 [Choristoneura fumiferana]|uniref:Uncharacterized protein n=1 Tax=Choristoneura fumiferana TaxID=7141 RepID=A0ACC0K4Z5_CHOFU|nr:hypothetical protein MSG28_015983 [Choristoneura fumiferana]
MAVRALKTMLVLVILAVVVVCVIGPGHVRVPACDEVCGRTDPEKDACCKAHGNYGWNNCYGGKMECYR